MTRLTVKGVKQAGPDLQSARAQDTRSLILCHVACCYPRPVCRLHWLLVQNLHALFTVRVRFVALDLLALAKRLRRRARLGQDVSDLKVWYSDAEWG